MPLARTARFRLATSRVVDRTIHAAPPLRARAWRSARRYVGGRTADEALAVARSLHAAGLASSIDLFGERVGDRQEAQGVAAAYVGLAGRLRAEPPGVWLSLDLSDVAFDLGFSAPSNFSRFFKEHIGVSPSTFRRAAIGQSTQTQMTA